jgi:phospholipase/carboxylesterase
MIGRIKIWEPQGKPRGTIIFLHGFGDSHRLFIPLAKKLVLPYPVRMIFPEASRKYFPADGKAKRAWFAATANDIYGQASGFVESDKAVEAIKNLVHEEQSQGIDEKKIIAIGFSQGGSLALACALAFPLGGVAAIAAFLRPESIERKVDQALSPVLMLHGHEDSVVPIGHGRDTAEQLKVIGLDVRWRSYEAMGHELKEDLIQDLQTWLIGILED